MKGKHRENIWNNVTMQMTLYIEKEHNFEIFMLTKKSYT